MTLDRATSADGPAHAADAEFVDAPSANVSPDADAKVSALEFVAFAVAAAIGLLSLVSLAAAHLHQHTPALVFPVAAALVLVIAAIVWRWDRPALRVDRGGLIAGGVAVVIAAFMFFPGFQYATSDRDPGGYVQIAAQIQRSHSIEFSDPLVSPSLPAVAKPYAVQSVWPGLWNEPGRPGKIFPQFYQLWPALMASAKDVGGWTGLFDLGPLVGVVAVALTVAVARRLAGLTGAWVAGAFMATNMLEVWQSKYPSAEIFGQMLFMAAILGAVIAIRTGWRSAAALAGVLLSLSYLERADGIAVVLIAWAVLAALLAARKFDARAGWFTAGLVVLLPYGFYQAYHLAKTYTLVNSVPTFRKVLEIMAVLAIVAGLLAWQGGLVRRLISWSGGRRQRLALSVFFVAACAALMIVGFLRPIIFGKDYGAGHQRTFDEISLVRLSWFVSLTGFALLGAGIVWIAMRRWRVENWIVALTAVPLLALYCWHVRNSTYLMWSFRRFVTTVLPGMAILIGCGVAWCAWLVARYLNRAVAVAATVGVILGLSVFYLSESAPLRHHNENGGSLAVVEQMAALSGGHRGVFVWDGTGPCCSSPSMLFGGSLLTIGNQDSTLAPADPKGLSVLLSYYVAHPGGVGRPVFYVLRGAPQAVTISGVAFTPVRELAGTLPHWAETYTSRPKGRADYAYDFTVYQVSSAG
jgi:hypothetical protein